MPPQPAEQTTPTTTTRPEEHDVGYSRRDCARCGQSMRRTAVDPAHPVWLCPACGRSEHH